MLSLSKHITSGCLVLLAAMFITLPAQAQTFPELTGRVVDAANVIPDDVEARLKQKLEALEAQSQRQVVVATIPDLQGYDIADYGYQLGRHWQIGDKQRNDGVVLIIAPNERKVRIEVGYGLEPILTDGLTSIFIQQDILPKFKAGDMPGGIEAGTDDIVKQLTLPAEDAQKIAAQAKPKMQNGASAIGVIFWLAMFFIFFILPMIGRAGRTYRSNGVGNIILWSVLNGMANSRHSGGSGWSSGGSSSDWGGGGGFSGGGGSFGGGGSSGSW